MVYSNSILWSRFTFEMSDTDNDSDSGVNSAEDVIDSQEESTGIRLSVTVDVECFEVSLLHSLFAY